VTGTAPIYMCRAWVNFDGTTATPSTIRGSGNVSSVTKNATGQYTITFTTAMPDANYVISNSNGDRGAGESSVSSASQCAIINRNSSFSTADSAQIFVAVFR
jgi:hypothetical protein